ncbi:MAG: type II secretion system F family protein [bacterium]
MFNQVKKVEILLFTKHLGIMVKAGVPLVKALTNLAGDTKNSYFAKVIIGITQSVEAGHSLASSFAQYPKLFDSIYTSLVTIGEESGHLDVTLTELASQLSKLHALRRKVQAAMLYPGLVVGTMFVIGIGLSIFVLPKLVDFFAAFDQKLPLSTQILLWFANLMKNSGILIAILLILSIAIFNLLIRWAPVKRYTDRWLFKLPLLGNFFRDSQMASISRNLSILLNSGVPLSKGLNTLITAEANFHLHDSLDQLQASIQKGNKISSTITNNKLTIFPNLFVQMVSVGEETGNLDTMLLYLADYYEDEVEVASKNLTTLLEPILLLAVGLAVGFMALAIIGPIYQITGSIGG